MEKTVFIKRMFIWVAVIAAVIILILGLTCGKVIEESLFAEITKWIAVGGFVIGILEVFVYVLAPVLYHAIYDKREKDEKID